VHGRKRKVEVSKTTVTDDEVRRVTDTLQAITTGGEIYLNGCRKPLFRFPCYGDRGQKKG